MLKDQDRIFQNLYNDLGPDLTSSQKRGDWVNTKEITDIKIIDIKYLNKIFDLISQKIVAKIIIKKGFKTSIGWNLGKKNKSIHLLDPLTSTPTNGTKNKEISEIKKRKIEYLYNWSEFKEENIKIRDIPINT